MTAFEADCFIGLCLMRKMANWAKSARRVEYLTQLLLFHKYYRQLNQHPGFTPCSDINALRDYFISEACRADLKEGESIMISVIKSKRKGHHTGKVFQYINNATMKFRKEVVELQRSQQGIRPIHARFIQGGAPDSNRRRH